MSAKAPTKSLDLRFPTTPQRPSQARRAQFARSPATSHLAQKRPRTPSPSAGDASGYSNPVTPKQRKTEGGGRLPTPALTPSQRASRQAEIEKGLSEAKRLANIQEALSACQGTSSQERGTSRTSFPSSNRGQQTSEGRSSRNQSIEAALLEVRQQLSDTPALSTPPASQNRDMTVRPHPSTQSDAGYSITSEIEEAEWDDLEEKAVQTDPIEDDEDSIMEDFFNSPSSRSVPGSPVAPIFTLGGAAADSGAGTSRPLPGVETERGSSTPALHPHTTPGRGRSMRMFTPGGNEGGTLPTPPGTSETVEDSGSQPSRHPRPQARPRSLSPSPSPVKGKGKELPRSANSSGSKSHWEMIQDDPENPFHERVAALRVGTPPSNISGADSMSANTGWVADPPSAGAIESQSVPLPYTAEDIRRLQRRERAAQNSVEIKARRIVQLEEQVQRLTSEKRALEETIAAMQMRR